jgi:uncharacterized Zn finger protein
MSTKVIEKAQRLLNTGHVREATSVRTFVVDGDHGRYAVLVGDTVECTCPATRPDCAHVTAVLLQLREENR